MRKDYDLMSAKLDQLSKEFEYVQQNTEVRNSTFNLTKTIN